jgi:hypothetical protein
MHHVFGILDVNDMSKYDMTKYSSNGQFRYNVDKTKVLIRITKESDIIPELPIYTQKQTLEILKKSDWKRKLV